MRTLNLLPEKPGKVFVLPVVVQPGSAAVHVIPAYAAELNLYAALFVEEVYTMVHESFQVNMYQYYCWSSRTSGKTNLILKGVGGEICSVWFIEDEDAELPHAYKVNPDYYAFYYHHSQLQHLIDMLRNEKPIFVFFSNTDGLNNSRISTTHEPVGEGEES